MTINEQFMSKSVKIEYDKAKTEHEAAYRRIDKLIAEMECQLKEMEESRNFWRDTYIKKCQKQQESEVI